MPVIARGAFAQVVPSFVFVTCMLLVVLFITPFRDIPFVAQHATGELTALRALLLGLAVANFVWTGYTLVPVFSLRWIVAMGVSVMILAVLAIDLRRIFPS
jgi:hypothetical protein